MVITTVIPEKAISQMMIAISTAISVGQIGLLLNLMIMIAEGEKVIEMHYLRLLTQFILSLSITHSPYTSNSLYLSVIGSETSL